MGEQPHHTKVLWIMFIAASFVCLVHMLNMLVAIMGDTFAKNGEVSEQMIIKEKLNFVIDNYWINPFGDYRKRIQYLVAALVNEEDDEDIEIIKDLR